MLIKLSSSDSAIISIFEVPAWLRMERTWPAPVGSGKVENEGVAATSEPEGIIDVIGRGMPEGMTPEGRLEGTPEGKEPMVPEGMLAGRAIAAEARRAKAKDFILSFNEWNKFKDLFGTKEWTVWTEIKE